MFKATWRHGPEAELKANTWIKAVNEALTMGLEDPQRDELLKVEWIEE